MEITNKKVSLLKLGVEVFQEQGPTYSKFLRQERTERRLEQRQRKNGVKGCWECKQGSDVPG